MYLAAATAKAGTIFNVSLHASACVNKSRCGSAEMQCGPPYKWLQVFWQVIVHLFYMFRSVGKISFAPQHCNHWRCKHEIWQRCIWDQNGGQVQRWVWYEYTVTGVIPVPIRDGFQFMQTMKTGYHIFRYDEARDRIKS